MNDQSSKQATSGDDPGRDLRLMQLITTGDEEAFRELVEAHQNRVIGTIVRMLGSDSDTEDIAQEVFVRVWKNAARWEPSGKFTTWLYVLIRNCVFNELRRRKRHPADSLDAMQDDKDHPRQFNDPSIRPPDAEILDVEMQHAIEKAILELPEAQRMAVILRRYQEVSYEEIAEVLDLTVLAVKSVLFRARTTLREKLREYLDE